MLAFLKELRAATHIGMVGGSDLSKQKEQLGDDVLSMFDYVFPENGLMAFKEAKLFATTSLKEFLGEEKLKAFINAVLGYLATLDIPIKR
jgi:phosphomannomutase